MDFFFHHVTIKAMITENQECVEWYERIPQYPVSIEPYGLLVAL